MAIKVLPILPRAKRGNLKLHLMRKSNKQFKILQQKVFERDNYACAYCGFRLDKYQQVVNIDNNMHNNRMDNLATCCSLCFNSLMLDSCVNAGEETAWVIFFPEISQANLNNLSRILFTSMSKDPPYFSKLQSLYLSLKDRAQVVENVFGPNTSRADKFGEALIDCRVAEESKKHVLLNDLRVLPNKKFFKTQIEYWNSGVFANVPL